MSVTTSFGTDLLKLILTATPIANIADNAASSPLTTWYVSAHTASPGAAGDQTTNECAYAGYARIAITRDTDGFTVVSAVGDNDALLSFGQCVANPGSNITHIGFGTASSGAGSLKIFGELNAPIIMQVGSVPIFDPGELDWSCI